MTTLENSYCVPRTVEEWQTISAYFSEELSFYKTVKEWMDDFIICGYTRLIQVEGRLILTRHRDGRTEIPVPRFLDLLHDRICAWRLAEYGFLDSPTPDMMWKVTDHGILCVSDAGVWMNHMRSPYNLTTFTDLLTLIRMLTPPSK